MDAMNIILWVVFGGIAGWVGSMIVGGDAQMGLLGNIVVGIIGAFIGGWIADRMGASDKPGPDHPFTIRGFVFAVLGAIILLFIINLIF